MSDITEFIRRDVEDDVTLKPHAFTVDLVKKRLIGKSKILRIGGTVSTEHERDRIRSIVDHHAGDAYRIEFNVTVRKPAQV